LEPLGHLGVCCWGGGRGGSLMAIVK
jgi:hypothetical protein